jgi:hypothetical protein
MISTIGVRDADNDNRDVIQVAKAVGEAWFGAWGNPNLVSGWTFNGCDAVKGSDIGEIDVGSWDTQNGGSAPGPCPSSNCSLMIKKKTARGGRWNTGRMFLPAGYLTEGTVDPLGGIAQSALNVFAANLAQFLVNLEDPTAGPGDELTNFLPVLFHNDPSREPTEITSLVADRTIATQRQRMRR